MSNTGHNMQKSFSKYPPYPIQQLSAILAKHSSERIGVGGSTGDSDVGEQSSQSSTSQKNPGDVAISIEQALFEKTGTGG